jgi:hypothetical protein
MSNQPLAPPPNPASLLALAVGVVFLLVGVHRECFRQLRLSALESLCAHRRDHGRLRARRSASAELMAPLPRVP